MASFAFLGFGLAVVGFLDTAIFLEAAFLMESLLESAFFAFMLCDFMLFVALAVALMTLAFFAFAVLDSAFLVDSAVFFIFSLF